MGRERGAGRRRVFADVVDAVRVCGGAGGEAVGVRSPIRERRLIDESGTVWRIRGGELRWGRLERLVRDPAALVVLVYLDEVKEIQTAEREDLLATIRPYLKPSGDGRALGEHTDFVVAEFKDDDHRSMVVVEQHC